MILSLLLLIMWCQSFYILSCNDCFFRSLYWVRYYSFFSSFLLMIAFFTILLNEWYYTFYFLSFNECFYLSFYCLGYFIFLFFFFGMITFLSFHWLCNIIHFSSFLLMKAFFVLLFTDIILFISFLIMSDFIRPDWMISFFFFYSFNNCISCSFIDWLISLFYFPFV